MQTDQATWDAVLPGPLYMDFDMARPLKVWTVEYKESLGRLALATEPFPGLPNLVWALREAVSIGRQRSGFNITFWRGATGWYPCGNARLAVAGPLTDTS